VTPSQVPTEYAPEMQELDSPACAPRRICSLGQKSCPLISEFRSSHKAQLCLKCYQLWSELAFSEMEQKTDELNLHCTELWLGKLRFVSGNLLLENLVFLKKTHCFDNRNAFRDIL
jgi:hypothetical protein